MAAMLAASWRHLHVAIVASTKPRDRSPAGRSERSLSPRDRFPPRARFCDRRAAAPPLVSGSLRAISRHASAARSLAVTRPLSQPLVHHCATARRRGATSDPSPRDRLPQHDRSRDRSHPRDRSPVGRCERSRCTVARRRAPVLATARRRLVTARRAIARRAFAHLRRTTPLPSGRWAKPLAAPPLAGALADARPLARPLVTARLRSLAAARPNVV